MVAPHVTLSHDVEKEGISIIVESLVIKEQLGQQTKILGIQFVLATIQFKEGN